MQMQGEESLETLIPQYAQNKSELDSYKKICDDENKQIKDIMSVLNLEEKEVGGWIAKYYVQKRESMNEDKVLDYIHADGVLYHKAEELGIIKTKEYIDYDALEKAIYNDELSKETLIELDNAKEVKLVPTLKLVKAKKEKE